MIRPVLLVLLLTLATACAGTSQFDKCVQHSVDEGLDRTYVEQACREAGREE